MINQSTQIYALKVSEEWKTKVFSSLQNGEGRFGWSYIENADLNELKNRVKKDGWASLNEEEQNCYQSFLLELKPDDYVVYINVPSWGQCTIAKVIGSYYWKKVDNDFNHHFLVDKTSVLSFDRNDHKVQPALSRRLKLLGRFWRIRLTDEFESLVAALQVGHEPKPRLPIHNIRFLSEKIDPLLLNITRAIQHTHPSSNLEHLIAETFRGVPGVRDAVVQGGAGDHGADIVVTFLEGLPIPGLEKQSRLIVQVKSYIGEHWDKRAVEDIRRAFQHYPDSGMGLIVSTADKVSQDFERALDNLRQEILKPIAILVGRDVAAFFLQFGSKLLN